MCFDADFGRFMTKSRFFYIFTAARFCKGQPNVAGEGDWAMFDRGPSDYNANRLRNIRPGPTLVLDESMSAWRPRTTELGGLENLSYIKRKPEPLGTEFKVAVDGKSGVMLHLEIQKGVEKGTHGGPRGDTQFYDELGAWSACALRVGYRATPWEINSDDGPKKQPGHLILGDSWFSSAKTANAFRCGLACSDTNPGFHQAYSGPVKVAHTDTPKTYLETKMADMPGGTHMVLTGRYKDKPGSENDLVCVGYKYNSRKVLVFIHSGELSTRPGKPYLATFRDARGAAEQREVQRPRCVAEYFAKCQVVDVHNQLRQYELALEKAWVPKGYGACYGRLMTTLWGMTVVDTFLAAKSSLGHGHMINTLTLKKFVKTLADQLVNNTAIDDRPGSGLGGAKRTVTGTVLNADGARKFSVTPTLDIMANGMGHKQLACVVCKSVAGVHNKKTIYRCPDLDNKPVCSELRRGCVGFLRHFDGLPAVIDSRHRNKLQSLTREIALKSAGSGVGRCR